jgi:hypothetical protein
MKDLIGTNVVVRSGQAGVFIGCVLDVDKDRIKLKARKIWNWEGANTVQHIALAGILKGRVGPSCVQWVSGWCEVIPATSEAVESVGKVSPW